LLAVPRRFGQQKFSHWDVLDLSAMRPDRAEGLTYEASSDRSLRLTCVYTEPSREGHRLGGEKVVRAAVSSARQIYDRPSAKDGEMVGIVPADSICTPLDEEPPVEADGTLWRKIDFAGMVGWISD